MKAHLGNAGKGSSPLCGANIYRTSGFSTDRASFATLDADFQCRKCAKKFQNQSKKQEQVK